MRRAFVSNSKMRATIEPLSLLMQSSSILARFIYETREDEGQSITLTLQIPSIEEINKIFYSISKADREVTIKSYSTP